MKCPTPEPKEATEPRQALGKVLVAGATGYIGRHIVQAVHDASQRTLAERDDAARACDDPGGLRLHGARHGSSVCPDLPADRLAQLAEAAVDAEPVDAEPQVIGPNRGEWKDLTQIPLPQHVDGAESQLRENHSHFPTCLGPGNLSVDGRFLTTTHFSEACLGTCFVSSRLPDLSESSQRRRL